MRFTNLILLPVFVLIFLGGGLIPISVSNAEEPAEEFVKALVNERFYDVAADYLEKAQNSELVPEDFRAKIPYERAKILVRSAASDNDQQAREEKFDLADQLLNTYASALSTPLEKFNVLLESANIKVKRSEIQLNRSKKPRIPAEEKSAMIQKADSLLRSAMSQYESGQTELRDVLNNFQLDPEDPKSAATKKQLQQQYLSIRTQQPLVTERLADTLAADSPERRELLKKAVQQSEGVYDTYRRVKKQAFIFKAAINGARASQKLGDHEKTLQLLDYVFEIGNGAAEDRLKKDAMIVAVDSWSQIDPYPWKKVIEVVDKRVARLNRSEINQPQWQRIQLELASAKLTAAAAIREKGGAGAANEIKSLSGDAKKLVRKIVRTNGPHRALAKSIVDKWKLSFAKAAPGKAAAEVKNFSDAKEVASELTASVVELQNEVRKQKSLLSRTTGPGKRATLSDQIEENTARLTEEADAALDFYQTALAMADESTSREDVNFLRYHQSLCYFAKGQPLQSALIAEFLLDKYPTVAWTRQASANIVKGYSALLASAPKDDNQYETNKLMTASREICERWPDSNESAIAAATIVQSSIRNKDLAAAEQFFALIPDSFSSKPLLAAALGEKFWGDYRTNGELDEAGRQKRLVDAAKLLQSVVSNPPDPITYSSASAALSLIGVRLEQNKIEEAIQLLETGSLSPMKLIEQKHPAIEGSRYANRFRQSTNRTAIKTYLAAVTNGGDQKQSIDKAIGILTAMQNDPNAKSQLTAIYRSVGKSLNDQFEGLKSLDEQKQFASVLASFVGTIEKGSTDTSTVLWAGSTLLKVASSLSEQGATGEAAPLFGQANSALERAETLGVEDPNAKLALQHLKALALRGSGDYQGSVSIFEELLKQKALLTWQLDAAETLQMCGKNKQDANAYAKAMMGSGKFKDPKTKREKNAIWGWRKLVQVTRGNEKFNDAYRTSIYNSVKSRFEYGLLKQNAKAINSSYSELSKALQRFKFLSTGPWNQKFQTLIAEMKKHTTKK
jgi:ribosomal protein S20